MKKTTNIGNKGITNQNHTTQPNETTEQVNALITRQRSRHHRSPHRFRSRSRYRYNRSRTRSRSNSKGCYRCGRTSHIAKNCYAKINKITKFQRTKSRRRRFKQFTNGIDCKIK